MIFNTLIGFIVLAILETLNGIVRIRYLNRKFNKQTAKTLSFLSGSLSVVVVNVVFVPIIKPQTLVEAFLVGLSWMVLMLSYDIFVGRALFRVSWNKIFEDFNILKGNLLGVGMLLILLLPSVIVLIDF